MKLPISITLFLWNHQVETVGNYRITHGKGRKGIIIRARQRNSLLRIKNAFSWGQK